MIPPQYLVKQQIQLLLKASILLFILLTIPCRIVHNKNNKNVNVFLSVQSTKVKNKIVRKLHYHFAHVPSDKLIKLIDSAGEHEASDHILQDKIKNICKNCPMCLSIRKHHQDPQLAGFPTGVESIGGTLQNLMGEGLESIHGGSMGGGLNMVFLKSR